MSLRSMLFAAQKFAIHNSPSILTAIGVAGTISTAVLTGRAAYSSASLIENATIELRQQRRGTLSTKEKVEVVWKEFIPPAVVGVVTLSAIIGANHISTRRAAAFAAAYKLSEKMAEEYRQKVLETMGEKKEELLRSDVARERIARSDGVETIVLNDAEIVFYDSWSGRAFKSTRQRVEDAVNQVNYQINHNWAMSLTEFYNLLDLPSTAVSDDFGWNTDTLLSLYYTSTLLTDGRPACEIRYEVEPFQNFHKIGI